ncbi:MAG: YdcF family protein, partial [Clostridia bacterium]|nr:YdcF family protein [Clostridia bacterium]
MCRLRKQYNITHREFLDMGLLRDRKFFGGGYLQQRCAAKLRTFITDQENVEFIETVNSISALRLMRDKIRVLNRLKAYCRREYLDLRHATIDDFRTFVRRHPSFVAKDPCGSFAKNVSIVRDVETDAEADRWYEILQKNRRILVEEMLVQHPALKQLSPTGVACTRIHTLNTGKDIQVVLPVFIQCSCGGLQVSNGGISLELNRQTGEGINEEWGRLHHPDTGVALKGFVVPFIREAQQLVIRAASELPEVNFIAWDVAITPDGPAIIEGNGASHSYSTLYRLCAQRGDYNLKREYAAIVANLRFHKNDPDVSQITEDMFHSLPAAELEPDVVAILGSNKCGYRVDKALEYLAGLASKPLVIASGGNPCGEAGYTHMTEAAYMKLRLLEADIPEERILCEENSRNTTQNAENILELINKHLSNLERPVVSVVTGGFHMRRVFRDFGLLQGLHPLRLQAVPAYGNHTRPDNWYKNLMGTYIVLNELRHLGIESPDAQWHTANPDDVLLNRPAVKYVEAPEQDASCLPVRKGNIKGILLCCNDGRQEPLCARSHYLVRLDGTIVQQIPDNHV